MPAGGRVPSEEGIACSLPHEGASGPWGWPMRAAGFRECLSMTLRPLFLVVKRDRQDVIIPLLRRHLSGSARSNLDIARRMPTASMGWNLKSVDMPRSV